MPEIIDPEFVAIMKKNERMEKALREIADAKHQAMGCDTDASLLDYVRRIASAALTPDEGKTCAYCPYMVFAGHVCTKCGHLDKSPMKPTDEKGGA